MEPILIARTEPKERMDVDHGQRWTEYRLVEHPLRWLSFAVEMRHIRTDREQVTEEDWCIWQQGGTKPAAVEAGMGDTAYEEATSLHPLHKAAVERSRLVRASYDRIYKAEQALRAAQYEVARYKFHCDQEFAKKVRGVDDSAKIERIKQRMLKTRGPIMDGLRLIVEGARKELEAAKEEAKALGLDC